MSEAEIEDIRSTATVNIDDDQDPFLKSLREHRPGS
jgi:hypothetical protein